LWKKPDISFQKAQQSPLKKTLRALGKTRKALGKTREGLGERPGRALEKDPGGPWRIE
jgi:hypothetical protein